MDHFALGADTAFIRQAEFGDPGELDPANGFPRMAWVLTNRNLAAKWDISNNYYAVSDSGLAMHILPQPNGPYYQGPGPKLTWGMNTTLAANAKDSTKTFTNVDGLKLAKTPPLMTKMIRWIYRSRADGGDGKQKNGNDPNFTKDSPGHWTYDYNRKSIEYYFDTLNCKISASSTILAKLISSDGKTVGDPRWGTPTVGVSQTEQIPGTFSLEQNYPNPFNPTTDIVYSVPKQSRVKLEVFNVLGQKVATLVDESKNAGQYSVSFGASNLSSGVYVYRLSSETQTISKKMVLMK